MLTGFQNLVVNFSAPIAALALFIIAAVFLVSPEWAMANFAHTYDGLPLVMGGRYLGLAILFAIFAYLRDFRALAIMFAVGAVLGFYDFFTYLNVGNTVSNTAQHLSAGVLAAVCFAVFWYAYKNKERTV